MGLFFQRRWQKRVLTGPVLARAFGAGYEAIEGGRDSGRHVDQRCAGIYCLYRIRHRKGERHQLVVELGSGADVHEARSSAYERKLTAVSVVGASIPSAHRPSILTVQYV